MDEPDPTRESRLSETFVTLADTLVTGFDVVDLMDVLVRSSLDLLAVASAGIMLTDQRGNLRVMAASSEATRLLELLELQNQQGPCLDCFSTGDAVLAPDLAATRRWPIFTAEAATRGVGAAYALPLRLREDTVGALNLFGPPGSSLSRSDLRVGQALADVATIALLSHRSRLASKHLTEQLQTALNSRVVIERANGILVESAGVDVDRAFQLLRAHARRTSTPITDVAQALVCGRLAPQTIAPRRVTDRTVG